MPVRHLLVWLAAGAACWSLLAAAAFLAPEALLALGALLALPWLRRPGSLDLPEAVEPVLARTPVVDPPGAGRVHDGPRVLVAQSA
jgi:hypothetical protein